MLRGLSLLAGAGTAASSGATMLLVLLLALHRGAGMACTFPSGTTCSNPMVNHMVQEAMLLQEHLSGAQATDYDRADPVMQPAYRYWAHWCGDGVTPCHEAVSGNLQCVSFVNAVFALTGHPLPASGNGEQFWPLYEHVQGWLRIPGTEFPSWVRGLPHPGDLMIWKGGAYGHVAVVIAVAPPTAGQDGSVTVAQANAPGNRWPPAQQADSGNWYHMLLHPDLSVATWDGYVVRGYLRQMAMA